MVIGEGNHISPSLSPADLSPVTSNRTVGSRNSPSLLMPPFPNAASYGRKSPSFDRIECHEILNWTPWKTGIAFAHRGRTLLVMKQVTNQPSDEFLKAWGTSVHLLKSEYRIEIHIYTNEWVTLCVELMDLNLPSFPLDNMSGLATKLLVMLTGHVKTLATTFFAGMLSLLRGGMFSSYVPCWKCFAEIGSPKDLCAGEAFHLIGSVVVVGMIVYYTQYRQCVYFMNSLLYTVQTVCTSTIVYYYYTHYRQCVHLMNSLLYTVQTVCVLHE